MASLTRNSTSRVDSPIIDPNNPETWPAAPIAQGAQGKSGGAFQGIDIEQLPPGSTQALDLHVEELENALKDVSIKDVTPQHAQDFSTDQLKPSTVPEKALKAMATAAPAQGKNIHPLDILNLPVAEAVPLDDTDAIDAENVEYLHPWEREDHPSLKRSGDTIIEKKGLPEPSAPPLPSQELSTLWDQSDLVQSSEEVAAAREALLKNAAKELTGYGIWLNNKTRDVYDKIEREIQSKTNRSDDTRIENYRKAIACYQAGVAATDLSKPHAKDPTADKGDILTFRKNEAYKQHNIGACYALLAEKAQQPTFFESKFEESVDDWVLKAIAAYTDHKVTLGNNAFSVAKRLAWNTTQPSILSQYRQSFDANTENIAKEIRAYNKAIGKEDNKAISKEDRCAIS